METQPLCLLSFAPYARSSFGVVGCILEQAGWAKVLYKLLNPSGENRPECLGCFAIIRFGFQYIFFTDPLNVVALAEWRNDMFFTVI